jgi:hypothetical protein
MLIPLIGRRHLMQEPWVAYNGTTEELLMQAK